jgi:hypothetical protein
MNKQDGIANDRQRMVPLHVVFEGEMTIDAPVRYVWRRAIDYPSWQNYSLNQHVSGPPGGEGEVVMLQKDENVVAAPTPFYARTIKIYPERRIIWKTYRDNVDYFGIVEFRMYEVEGRTRFFNNALYEWWLPAEQERELQAIGKERLAVTEALFSTVYPRLKQLAESDARNCGAKPAASLR